MLKTMVEENIQVFVVEDQALVRDGIVSLLDIQPGISVIGSAENGAQAVQAVTEMKPDVILMDINMPEMNGIEATKAILAENEGITILMLTTMDDEENIVKSLKAGAAGYLLKDILAADLAQAVRMAYKKVYQLSPSIAGKLVQLSGKPEPNQAQGDEYTERLKELTPREIDVLRLLATGASNREIAQTLFLSEGTVKNIVSRIFQCLGIRDRIKAAVIAIHNGLG